MLIPILKLKNLFSPKFLVANVIKLFRIIWSFWINENQFENKVLLKPVSVYILLVMNSHI